MIIDVHTHVFPEKIAQKTLALLSKRSQITPYTDGTLTGLKKSMKDAAVDLSVLAPVVTNPEQFDSILRFAGTCREEGFIPFAGIHPENTDYKEKLKRIKEEGFKGIKLHPDYQTCLFTDIRYKRILYTATELDLVVLVHAGVDVGLPQKVHCTPKMSREVIRDVQPKKLILAHLGGADLLSEVEEYLVGEEVYLDTAFVLDGNDNKQQMRIIRNHGIDKILFATDSPWASQKEFVQIIRDLELDSTEKEKIFSGNARRVLDL